MPIISLTRYYAIP